MLTRKESLQNETKTNKNNNNKNHLDKTAPAIKAPEDAKTSSKTRVTIKYDVGFSNQIYIRGQGANLNWDKGTLLKNVKNDEWVWETDANFNQCEFKVLMNDCDYEKGENHQVKAGSTVLYTPQF